MFKFSNNISLCLLRIFLLISSIVLKSVHGQACDPGCQREINGIYDTVDGIRNDVNVINIEIQNLQKRTTDLENFYYNDVEPFMIRINNWQPQVVANFTAVTKKLEDEIFLIYEALANNINSVKAELNGKIGDLQYDVNYLKQNLPTNPTPTIPSGSIQDVYFNLTQKIWSLETGKIQNLSADNAMWRRNFRVINSTFERMKRNNCLC